MTFAAVAGTLRRTMPRRAPTRKQLGLSYRHWRKLRSLSSPQKIQAFLNAMPANHELEGETIMSVTRCLTAHRAHCIEGAMVAAAALWVNGERPLLLHLKAVRDYHHVVTLFRRGRYWGAVSKTNAVYLRYRDPVYRSLRELAVTFLHEYANRRGEKTLRSYSLPFDLSAFPVERWITGTEDLWELDDRLYEMKHFDLVTPAQAKRLRYLDGFQRGIGRHVQHPRPKVK
jgi:hypothetical protein